MSEPRADDETQAVAPRAAHDAPTNAAPPRDAVARLLGADARGAPAPAAGDRLGSAVLVDVLGRGGMGVVWRARDTALGRDVAVKVLRHVGEPADLARFRAEGEAAARLRHPHVLRVHSAGEHQGWLYLVLDLVQGESLAARLSRTGPLDPRAAAEVARAVASALAHAHERGVVHRDVKPANVLLDAQGAPLLADFGLARDLLHDARLTPTGAIVGTPAYMAPEQLTGQPVDARADVWSLAVTLHELLTGATPFAGLDGLQLLGAMGRGPPRAGPAGLDAIVAGCLVADPAGRYPSAAALEADLGRWLAGDAPRPPRRRTRLAPGVAVFALALVAGASAVWTVQGGPAPAPTGPGPAPRRRPPPGPRGLEPRAACDALERELGGGAEADLDAIAAGLAAPGEGSTSALYAERARALAARALARRVEQAAALAAETDPASALAAAERAARGLGLDEAALADARLDGLRRAPFGAQLRAAIERRDVRRIEAMVSALARAARLAPPLDAARRVELARAVRAATWAAAPAPPRDDPRHTARVALDDALFYVLAPEAPPGDGLEWCKDEVIVAGLVIGRDRGSRLEAREALTLVRGHAADSWVQLQRIARAAPAARPELERRAAEGSAAARLLIVAYEVVGARDARGLLEPEERAEGHTPETFARLLAALQAVHDATVQDLPPGLRGTAAVKLAEAKHAAHAPPAEVEALAREALAHLDAMRAAGGTLTERTAEALTVVVRARHPDVPGMLAAAEEGLRRLERQAAGAAPGSREEHEVALGRAFFLSEVVGYLDGTLHDEAELLRWHVLAEEAAGRAGDYVFVALQRRAGRVRERVTRREHRQALEEAEAGWRTLGPAVRALLAEGDQDERDSLRSAARRLGEWAGRAAEALGDAEGAAAWRAELPRR